jgi:hypothetical protein
MVFDRRRPRDVGASLLRSGMIAQIVARGDCRNATHLECAGLPAKVAAGSPSRHRILGLASVACAHVTSYSWKVVTEVKQQAALADWPTSEFCV